MGEQIPRPNGPEGGRPRAEEEHGESEEKFRVLLEFVPVAIVITDAGGRIALANAKAEEIFGFHRQELVGSTVEALLPEHFREIHVSHRIGYVAEPRARPMGLGLDLVARRKDGTEFPVEIGLASIKTHGGILVIAFITDITERKRAEEAVRQAEKLAAVGTFAAGIIHEINNPVAIILNRVEVMLGEPETQSLPPQVLQDLRVLQRQAERVVGMAQRVLYLARPSPGLQNRWT